MRAILAIALALVFCGCPAPRTGTSSVTPTPDGATTTNETTTTSATSTSTSTATTTTTSNPTDPIDASSTLPNSNVSKKPLPPASFDGGMPPPWGGPGNDGCVGGCPPGSICCYQGVCCNKFCMKPWSNGGCPPLP